MLPTMYLRQLAIKAKRDPFLVDKDGNRGGECVIGYRLQQWCYTNDETSGPPVYLDATKLQELMRGEEVEGGAWRDVPIVEDV